MTYSALLKGRASVPGQIYLVTAAALDRRPTFADLQAGRAVVRAMRTQDQRGWCVTLAFVVMPDHCHWLLQITDRKSLSHIVKAMKAMSARDIAAIHGRGGSVWQRGFHDRALRVEEDVRLAARYVIANPVRAGLIRSVRDYSLWDAAWL